MSWTTQQVVEIISAAVLGGWIGRTLIRELTKQDVDSNDDAAE